MLKEFLLCREGTVDGQEFGEEMGGKAHSWDGAGVNFGFLKLVECV